MTTLAVPPSDRPGAVTRRLAVRATAGPTVTSSVRLDSIDVLRGAIMVLMVLDHVRAYFTSVRFDPLDLAETTLPLFATRWVTHFCAPTFVLLAGMSAWMAGRTRTCGELSRFLATRGLWLIVLEVTVVSFGWYFTPDFSHGVILQVIWAIGIAMLVLAGLVYLPVSAIAAVAVALIAGHNLLDGITGGDAWRILHVQGPLDAFNALVLYPVLPWIGVMALGYALGPVMQWSAAERRHTLQEIGIAMVVAFLVLRYSGAHGDPVPWVAAQDRAALAFLKVQKYPPSLLFLLVTLGPALVALALLDRVRGPVPQVLLTFGRVPLFFYVAHIYLLHAAALVGFAALGLGAAGGARLFLDFPPEYGFGLGVVYLVWIAVVAVLYPCCRWFGEVKRRGRGWWWSYL